MPPPTQAAATAAAAAPAASSGQTRTTPAGNGNTGNGQSHAAPVASQPPSNTPARPSGTKQATTTGAPTATAASSQQNGPQPPSHSNTSAAHLIPLTSATSPSLSFAAATAQMLALKTPLPLSDRSLYKTFILTNGVFEVESRYIMKELIGQGRCSGKRSGGRRACVGGPGWPLA